MLKDSDSNLRLGIIMDYCVMAWVPLLHIFILNFNEAEKPPVHMIM